jgi:methionyl-tRNA formyltransferase
LQDVSRKTFCVLCSDQPHHRYLVHQLHRQFDVALVVVEPESRRRRRMRREGRWTDFLFAHYHLLRRKALGLSAYRKRHFSCDPEAGARPPTLVVDWINDEQVSARLEAIKPDLTIVIGTSILKERTLRAATPALNIHGGYLPHYRGNHCFFFALYDRAYDRIGSTIHFVDAGIDTGDIVEHVVPPIHHTDTAETLYCRAELSAIHRLIELLRGLEAGKALPQTPQRGGRPPIKTRDRKPHHDLILWTRRKLERPAVGREEIARS